jgi:hypothetical protein
MHIAEADFKQYMELEIEKKQDGKLLKVVSVDIKNIKLDDISEYIYEHIDPQNNLKNPTVRLIFDGLKDDIKREYANNMLITRYCIHRILTKYKIWEKKNWQYNLMDDYWSQDVSTVKLKKNVADSLSKALFSLNKLSLNKKIEYLLKIEYGKLLPGVLDKIWRVTQVPVSQLYYSNPQLHEQCVKKGPLEFLDKYKLPRGLCIVEQPDKYKVIDGYARLSDTEARGNDNCLIIAGYSPY